MARSLIIGCGCRGRGLVRALVERGHAVRGTTRDAARQPEIEAAGAEAVVADPDQVGTLIGALEHVTVAVILLGSAEGSADALAALHGPRLETLLTRMVDTTVKGVVYEARGSVDEGLLLAGAASLRAFEERSRARIALLQADPSDPDRWHQEALSAMGALLGPR